MRTTNPTASLTARAKRLFVQSSWHVNRQRGRPGADAAPRWRCRHRRLIPAARQRLAFTQDPDRCRAACFGHTVGTARVEVDGQSQICTHSGGTLPPEPGGLPGCEGHRVRAVGSPCRTSSSQGIAADGSQHVTEGHRLGVDKIAAVEPVPMIGQSGLAASAETLFPAPALGPTKAKKRCRASRGNLLSRLDRTHWSGAAACRNAAYCRLIASSRRRATAASSTAAPVVSPAAEAKAMGAQRALSRLEPTVRRDRHLVRADAQ